jgi:hypothetical protein
MFSIGALPGRLVNLLVGKVKKAWQERESSPEGATWRGWKDTRRASGDRRFRIPALALTAGFAVWGALLPSTASGEVRAMLAVAGVLGGALVVGLVTFAMFVAAAPFRQRDEARAKLARAVGPPSLQTFSALLKDLDGFMAKVAVKKPTKPGISCNPFEPDSVERYTQAQSAYEQAVAEWQREALVEYHEKFRARVLPVLKGGNASEPQTVGHLEKIQNGVGYIHLEKRLGASFGDHGSRVRYAGYVRPARK